MIATTPAAALLAILALAAGPSEARAESPNRELPRTITSTAVTPAHVVRKPADLRRARMRREESAQSAQSVTQSREPNSNETFRSLALVAWLALACAAARHGSGALSPVRPVLPGAARHLG